MDVHENQLSSPSRASILDGAKDFRIDGAKMTSVGGNSSVNYSSNTNTYIFIKQESGWGFPSRNVLILLIASLFFYLLL